MDERWMPKDKPELLSTIQREWEVLLAAAEKLSDGEMSAPDESGWTPKDHLAHIAEWLNILVGYHFDGRPSHEVIGIPEDELQGWDVDAVNGIFFARSKDRSRKKVMEDLRKIYKQTCARIEAMSYEDMIKPRGEDDPVLFSILDNTTEHFAEHLPAIEKAE